MDIRYFKRADIDDARWNRTIEAAEHGLIYATTAYLDALANRQWDALIASDYTWIMPLPWRQKWGISYLYQPFACAALGIFGAPVTDRVMQAFLDQIPPKFKYWDIYFHAGHPLQVAGYPMYVRQNYVLPLANREAGNEQGYREQLRRNLKKARQAGCRFIQDVDLDELFRLAHQGAQRLGPVRDADYNAFRQLAEYLLQQKQASAFGVQAPNGQLLAAALFLIFGNRITYILVGNHPNGKTIGASHLLLHEVISHFAGQPVWLDFEGSDVKNVAFFYESFGAHPEYYPGLKLNRLPKWMAWLKE